MALHERYVPAPYHTMYGRAPRTNIDMLAPAYGTAWSVGVLDPVVMRSSVVAAQEEVSSRCETMCGKIVTDNGVQRVEAPSWNSLWGTMSW